MSGSYLNKKYFSFAVLFLFVPAFFANAALGAPALSDPVSNCSGSDPYITLSWSSVSGAASYKIFKNSVQIADVSEITYDDFSVSPKENLSYYIIASSATTTGPQSNTKNIIVNRCGPVLSPAVTSCDAYGSIVDFSWNSLSGASGYDVLRDGAVLASLPGGTTSYTDNDTDGSAAYTYKVRAKWSDGDQKDSNELINVVAPACPSQLSETVNCNAPGAQALLDWTTIQGATSYQIFRNGSFLQSTSGNTFSDDTVAQQSVYSYFIRTIFPSDSADSNGTSMQIPRCAPVLTTQSICNETNPTIPEIVLTWEGTFGSTLYNISEAVKGFVSQLTGNPPATTYKDVAGISNGTTYKYIVEAQGVNFNFPSNQSSVTPNCVASVPAPAPVLSAGAMCAAGDSQIVLTWTSSDNVLYYSLARTNNNSGSVSNFNLSGSATGYNDSNVEAGTSYSYRISAVGSGGSVQSNTVTLTAVSVSGCSAPSQPVLANPTASCISGGSAVNLSWSKSGNATKYQIFRNAALLTEINDINVITYQDLSVSNSSFYTYEIVAINAGGSSSSGGKSVTTTNCTVPTAPTLTLGSGSCGAGAISQPMSWTAAANATYYDVYRKKTTDPSYSYITSTTQLNYTDTVEQNTAYNYYVMAVGPGGSTPSSPQTKTTPACAAPDKPVISLSSSCNASSPAVTISWGATANANYYDIYRNGAKIGSTGAINYSDSGISSGTSYFYQVVAVGYGGSTASDSQNITTSICPPLTPKISGGAMCATQTSAISLSWDGTNSVESYYFDEGNGTSATSASGNTAILSGATWTTGKFGGGLNFDGVNDYAYSTGYTNLGMGNITISTWFKADTFDYWKNLVSIYTNYGTFALILVDNFNINAVWSGGYYHYANTSLAAGTWYHVAAVFDSPNDKVDIYLNGVLISSTPEYYSPDYSLYGTFYIGAASDTGGFFDGQMDDVRIYDMVLSASEIADLYANKNTSGTSYNLYKNGSLIATLGSSDKSYTDTTINAGQSYNYSVSATGPGGTSSSNVTGQTALNCALPGKPNVVLNFSCNVSVPYVTVTWNSVANATSYEVYRGGQKIASGITGTSYVDSLVSQNTTYSYTVLAISPGGNTISDSVSITTGNCAPITPALSASPICSAGNSTINLTWISIQGGLAAYDFENISGNLVSDISGNNNTGSLISGPMQVQGKNGQGIEFNGFNYMRIDNTSALEAGKFGADFSLDFWLFLKRDATGGWRNLLHKGNGDGDRTFAIWLNPYYNSLHYRISTSYSNNEGGNSSAIPVNVWTHVAYVKEGSQLKLYLNGSLDSTADLSGTVVSNTGPIYLGKDPWYGGTESIIDDFRIYNRALSANDVIADYNGTNVVEGITSYDIFRDGVKINSVLSGTNTYSDASRVPGQSYTYSVTAIGPGGSTPSEQVISTALNCSVPSKPVISSADPVCRAPGRALSVDGYNGYVQIPNSSSLEVGKNGANFSVELWVFPRESYIGYWRNLVHKGWDNSDRNFAIWMYPDSNRLYTPVSTTYSSDEGGSSQGQLNLNSWNHIGYVKDGSQLILYINGAIDSVFNLNGQTVSNTGPIYIGKDPWYYGVNSLIDEFRIYNRALSASEISLHYNGGDGEYGSAGSGLIAGYHFDEISGSTANDYSGNGHSGTYFSSGSGESKVALDPSSVNGQFPGVNINWSPTGNTLSYDIFRGATLLGNILHDAAKSSYTFADIYSSSNQISSGSSYSYQVTAKGNGGNTASDVVSSGVLPMCMPTTPSWKAGFPSATCSSGNPAVNLSWEYSEPADNAASFTIRRNDGSGFVTAATVAEAGSCTGTLCSMVYVDDNSGNGLVGGNSYTYEIVSNGPTGLTSTSPVSSSVTASTCQVDNIYLSSQCTVSGSNAVTYITFPRIDTDGSYYAAKQASTDPSFNNTYQFIYNSNASSPSLIREWLILGPFANDSDIRFDTDYISTDSSGTVSETTIMPRSGEVTAGKTWQRYAVPSDTDHVDFNLIHGYQEYILDYAFAYVVNTSGSAVNGQLRIGSDDGVKAYVNGTKVLDNHVHRGAYPDQDIVSITLNPGVNTILLKVDQGGGGWGFYARLTDTAGNPLLNTLTMTDSGVVKSQTSDYFVWSPSSMSSPVETTTAPSCTVGQTELTVTPACNAQGSVMNLSWGAVSGASYYQIWRGDTLDNIAPLVSGPDGGATVLTNYADSIIESGKEYYYAVEAISSSGSSSFSDAIPSTSLACDAVPDKPILTPANVTPICAGTESRMTLDWEPAANSISYTVRRDGVPLNPSVSTSAFTDGSLTALTEYTYEVEAVGGGGSILSDPVAMTTLDCNGPPAPPVLEIPIAFPESITMLLTWQDKSINEEGFRVNRTFLCDGNCIAMGPSNLFAQVFNFFAAVVADNLPMNSNLYSDSVGLVDDATYEYQLTAYNAAGSSLSNPQRAYMPIAPPGEFTLNVDCDVVSGASILDWAPGASSSPKGGTVKYNAYWSSSESGEFRLMPEPCSPDITATNCKVDVNYPETLWFKVIASNNGGTSEARSSKACTFLKYYEI